MLVNATATAVAGKLDDGSISIGDFMNAWVGMFLDVFTVPYSGFEKAQNVAKNLR
jgi:hypothetical protein